jgi:hypothetical protein
MGHYTGWKDTFLRHARLWRKRLIVPGMGNYLPLDNFLVVTHTTYEPSWSVVRIENR